MTIERDEMECRHPLPSYFAVDADGNILGTTYEGAILMGDEIFRMNYLDALEEDSISSISQPEPRQSTQDRLKRYNEVRAQVESLSTLPPEDEFGSVRPSANAIATTRQILLRMILSAAEIPLPVDISSDRDGSARCLWESDTRTLELVCSSDQNTRPYFYFSDGPTYRIGRDISNSRLSRLVEWLNGSVEDFPR